MSSDEQLLYRGSPSQKIHLFFYIAYGLASFLILPLFLIVKKYLETKNTKYEITTQRIRLTNGILSKTINDVELYRVKDYQIHQPFFYRIFNLSKIELVTSDRNYPHITLDGLSDAKELLNLIRHNVENMRNVKRVSSIDFDS